MTEKKRNTRKMVKMGAVSYAYMIKMLMEGTRTCAELAEETGLHVATIYDYTRELHKKKAIHIVSWEKDILGRDCMPVFMIGKAKDAERHRLTPAERQQNLRARRRMNGETKLDNWLKEGPKTNWT
jgi:hypothetical protein